MSFDPIAEGQKTAKENAKADVEATHGDTNPEAEAQAITDAQKLAKKNAKLDKAATTEAKMSPQKVSTSEVDIPEGAPVTDEPEVSETDESKASSKNPEVKKDMPDEEKRQDTDKDSATPSPDSNKTADKKQFQPYLIRKNHLEKPVR